MRHLLPAVQQARPGLRRGLQQRQQRQQQLKADHEAAAALSLKLGKQSCKELREAKQLACFRNGLFAHDLAFLGRLCSELATLESLKLQEEPALHDGLPRLLEGLSAGTLPAVTTLVIADMTVGDAGASALSNALGQGALPRLKDLSLTAAIGDAGLVALAPALRRLPALESLDVAGNPFEDQGLAALVASPPPPGAPPPTTTGPLATLKPLDLSDTNITNASCDTLANALKGGALTALKALVLDGTQASEAAQAAVKQLLNH